MPKKHQREYPLIFVSGLSGAGMSSALKSLEDMGYEVFDNFPLGLVEPLLHDPASKERSIAIGLDTRTRGFDQDKVLEMVELYDAVLLFISADENVLIKRFTETRRRHPLAKDRPVSSGIKLEQERLFNLKKRAKIVIDTTNLSIHDLRRVLEGHFKTGEAQRLTVTLMSFGFKHGIPREADVVMDVRFLKNPNWEPELKELTGLDAKVGNYIKKDKAFGDFLKRFQDLIKPLLPRYVQEGKSYLTIAIGCTGGHHRSVYSIERMKIWMEKQGHSVNVIHRDIMR